METSGGPYRPDDTVEHEAEHDENIREELEDASPQGVLTNVAAISGGEAPTEAEFNALVTRVNALTQVLRDAGLIPSA